MSSVSSSLRPEDIVAWHLEGLANGASAAALWAELQGPPEAEKRKRLDASGGFPRDSRGASRSRGFQPTTSATRSSRLRRSGVVDGTRRRQVTRAYPG
jgi:hypothetical protein